MSIPKLEIAQAFSQHRFEETVPHLSDDVRWNLVGGEQIRGKDAVLAECRNSAAYLSGVLTHFRRFRAVAGESRVVVESETEYLDKSDDSLSVVASCDIYAFKGERLCGITSYTVELEPN